LADLAECRFDTFDISRPLEVLYLWGQKFCPVAQVDWLDEREQEKLKPLPPDFQAKKLAEAFGVVQEFARLPRGWLFLTGACGAGKSHLAAAAANDLADRGADVRYCTLPGLLDTIKANFGRREGDGQSTSDAVFQDIRGCEVLVLDDLGAEHFTDWAKERVFLLLQARQGKPTIVTSNYDMDALAHPREIDGARIVSRLFGSSRRVWFPISDYRRLRGVQA
jgi:DNA replication protein DnaC